MKIKHVRMITIPNNDAQTITEITEAEASALKNNVFMRPGHVVLEGIENGYRITDGNGVVMLTAVFEETLETTKES